MAAWHVADWNAPNCTPAWLQRLGYPPIFIVDEDWDAVPQNHPGADDAGFGARRVSAELRHSQCGAPTVGQHQVSPATLNHHDLAPTMRIV